MFSAANVLILEAKKMLQIQNFGFNPKIP